MTESYYLAFTAGLLGGFGHCAGMCGPLAAGFAMRGPKGLPAIGAQALYNAGRIATYTAIGALMGLGGSFVEGAARMEGLQSAVMLIAGFMMILMGLGSLGVLSPLTRMIESRNAPVLRAAGALVKSPSPLRFLPLGLLMGLLPCGLSYTFMIGAAGAGSALAGALVMASFGAGTMPAMMLVGSAASLIGARRRGLLYKCGALVVIATGALFIYRGL